jgi:hypothetical protein
MRKGYVVSTIGLAAVLTSSGLAHAQTVAPKQSNQEATSPVDKTFPIHADGWGRPVVDAPKNQNPALVTKRPSRRTRQMQSFSVTRSASTH